MSSKNIGKVLMPGYEYNVGVDVPVGFYLISSSLSQKDVAINSSKYDEACLIVLCKCITGDYQRFCYRAKFGIVEIKESYDKFYLEHGYALYYGENAFNLFKLLTSGDKFDRFIFSNEVCQISLIKKDDSNYLYHGNIDMMISYQFWFSINSQNYWAGIIDGKTYRRYSSLKIAFQNFETGNQYLFHSLKFCAFESFSFSNEDHKAYVFRIKNDNRNTDFFVIPLPQDVSINKMRIAWLQPSICCQQLHPTEKSLDKVYAKAFSEISNLLKEYCALGLEINIEKELKKFLQAPDFASICSSILLQCLQQKNIIANKKKEEKKEIEFYVDISYDKKFYCAAKLADSAQNVSLVAHNNSYSVVFSWAQTEQIQLMYYNLCTQNNKNREDLVIAAVYLREYDFFSYVQTIIEDFIYENREQNGNSAFVNNSVLVAIIKAIDRTKRQKLNELYIEMVNEGRVTTKWGSEFKLFSLFKKYVADAEYQYRAEWLGQQSLDIYIPSQKVAVEYQGQQHYEPVEVFGGEGKFETTKERDLRKRQLCMDNNIVLLEWKYDIVVNDKAVIEFLQKNNIIFCDNPISSKITENGHKLSLEMAPVMHKKREMNNRKKHKFVIRQYKTTGAYVNEFDTIADAATKCGISEKCISKAVYGECDTGAGYLWRKCLYGSVIENIAPLKPFKRKNEAQSILQANLDGSIAATYESIGKAAKVTGIDRKGISNVLKGKQKTAGGYIWIASEKSD